MTKQLHLARGLILPLDAVTQKIAVLGMTGSGKSYCMTKLAELYLDAKAQVVIIDPKGEAWGLRLMADGKTPAYSIPVFGGDHADVPLSPDMGRRVAELLVERDYSAVLDVSEFVSSELAQFGYEFATRLFELKKRKPGAMALMIDEAQDFIPQNPAEAEKGYETKMLGAFERVGKQLRSKGVGMVIAGQRPQEINKKVLNMCELWFAFQMTGLQERETMFKLFKDKDTEEAARIKEELPKLETGHAHVWSPRLLKVSDTFLIEEKKTLDTSATPEVGARRVEPRTLAPVDLESLSAALEDVIERERTNDPAELKKKIARLMRELADEKKRAPRVEAKPVEVSVVKKEDLKRVEEMLKQIDTVSLRAERVMMTNAEIATTFANSRDELLEAGRQLSQALARAGSPAATAPVRLPPPAPPHTSPARETGPAADGDFKLSKSHRAILDALAWFETVGIASPTRTNVAAMAGVSPRSSGFEKNVSTLHKQLAAIRYPQDGCLSLTETGRGMANRPAGPGTLAQLHEAWLSATCLSGPQRLMLKALIARHPRAFTRNDLADALGVSALSSGFEKNVSTLSGLGLVTYPEPGNVIANAGLLFPPGLS